MSYQLRVYDTAGDLLCIHRFNDRMCAERAVWHYRLTRYKERLYWRVVEVEG